MWPTAHHLSGWDSAWYLVYDECSTHRTHPSGGVLAEVGRRSVCGEEGTCRGGYSPCGDDGTCRGQGQTCRRSRRAFFQAYPSSRHLHQQVNPCYSAASCGCQVGGCEEACIIGWCLIEGWNFDKNYRRNSLPRSRPGQCRRHERSLPLDRGFGLLRKERLTWGENQSVLEDYIISSTSRRDLKRLSPCGIGPPVWCRGQNRLR